MTGDTLASFPYVKVRLACRRCNRKGSYSLARLADKYGAEVRLMELLGHFAGDCAMWEPQHPIMERCGAYFVDLDLPKPPHDLPPAARRKLRAV
jgi:hypothetical protein